MKNIIKNYDDLLSIKQNLTDYLHSLYAEVDMCKRQIKVVTDSDNYWKHHLRHTNDLIKILTDILLYGGKHE